MDESWCAGVTPAQGCAVEPVETLQGMGEPGRPAGLYLALSRGSLHVFDLDAGAYLRVPGESSNSLPHDLAVLRLTELERAPRVGDSFFIWLDDPREYAVWDYWRQSSLISTMYCIERVAGAAMPSAPAEGLAAGAVSAMGSRDSTEAERPGLGSPRRPVPEEILPGLRLVLDRVWRVVTAASDAVFDDGAGGLKGPPVVEWPLRRSEGWETLLAVYGVSEGPGMRLRLDVRPEGGSGPRSSCGICAMDLQIGQSPPWPT